MRAAIFTIAILIATPVFADPGHFTELHGHSHWFAAGALALAALIGVAALVSRRKARKLAECEA